MLHEVTAPAPNRLGPTGDRMTPEPAVSVLRNAVAVRGPVDAIVRSARGSRFILHAYVTPAGRPAPGLHGPSRSLCQQ